MLVRQVWWWQDLHLRLHYHHHRQTPQQVVEQEAGDSFTTTTITTVAVLPSTTITTATTTTTTIPKAHVPVTRAKNQAHVPIRTHVSHPIRLAHVPFAKGAHVPIRTRVSHPNLQAHVPLVKIQTHVSIKTHVSHPKCDRAKHITTTLITITTIHIHHLLQNYYLRIVKCYHIGLYYDHTTIIMLATTTAFLHCIMIHARPIERRRTLAFRLRPVAATSGTTTIITMLTWRQKMAQH